MKHYITIVFNRSKSFMCLLAYLSLFSNIVLFCVYYCISPDINVTTSVGEVHGIFHLKIVLTPVQRYIAIIVRKILFIVVIFFIGLNLILYNFLIVDISNNYWGAIIYLFMVLVVTFFIYWSINKFIWFLIDTYLASL